MLGLLGGGVQHTLAAVDFHAHVQLKVDVPLSARGGDAALGGGGRRGRPEQSCKARRPPVGRTDGTTRMHNKPLAKCGCM